MTDLTLPHRGAPRPMENERAAREHAASPDPASQVLGRLGTLTVRLASDPGEIEAAQRLRHTVFRPGSASETDSLDVDRFDAFCDHLIVTDEHLAAGENIVATYRLMGDGDAAAAGGYYSESEFDLAPLFARHPKLRFLEFGRSCVLPAYRNRRTIELLWHGSWAYVRRFRYDVMFGCASFAGTDPAPHIEALSFLFHHAGARDDWAVRARRDCRLDFLPLPEKAIDARRAIRALPPLIKGYLRLGALFAREAAVDHAFGSLDVLVLLPVARLNPRYLAHYGMDAERHAAGI